MDHEAKEKMCEDCKDKHASYGEEGGTKHAFLPKGFLLAPRFVLGSKGLARVAVFAGRRGMLPPADSTHSGLTP